jgi:coenzyme PQQ precursor peptide PqqA
MALVTSSSREEVKLRLPIAGLPIAFGKDQTNCPTFHPRRIKNMQSKTWSRPDFKEVSLGCEINCYAPAEA